MASIGMQKQRGEGAMPLSCTKNTFTGITILRHHGLRLPHEGDHQDRRPEEQKLDSRPVKRNLCRPLWQRQLLLLVEPELLDDGQLKGRLCIEKEVRTFRLHTYPAVEVHR